VATHDERPKETNAELAGKLKQGIGTLLADGQVEAAGHAAERKILTRRKAVQVAERTARRTDLDGKRTGGEPMVAAKSYDALEADFCEHHQMNAAGRRGSYEDYRPVYRYGYDLGSDTRYRGADWSNVEQDARPRWEERNPSTWDEFKDTIRYAWEKARGQC
jgi:hypothetical protein